SAETVTPPYTAIDRRSPAPFYLQLAQVLEEQIVSGRWKPGDQLASEPSLSEHFGVSRSTVRQALHTLERGGHLSRRKGRGTFVAEAGPGSWLLQSSDGFFHAGVHRLGHRVTSKVLKIERGPLVDWAARDLGLERGADGVAVERLRSF